MFDKIDAMLEARYAYKENGLRLYDNNGEHIVSAIEALFEQEGFPISEYSIESNMVFSSPALDISYVSVAFVDWGRLHHTVYVVEG